jgi:hypothetical protein
MSTKLALLSLAFVFGCSRKPPPPDAQARAWSDAVDAPSIPTTDAPTARCSAIRVIVAKDAIHVTNAPGFAELDAQKRKELVAAATEDERYGLPLLARNVMRIENGHPSGGGHEVRAPLGPLRPVLDFARDIDKKLLETDDERLGTVEILADKSTPVGLLFDVAYTANLAGLRPMLRVRDGGGMSCTTLFVSNRVPTSDPRPTLHYPIAAIRVSRDASSGALRGCRVFAEPMCDALANLLRTTATPKDPCMPIPDDESTFTLLEVADEIPLGDLFDAFRDVSLGLRAFVLSRPGSRQVESFGKRHCHEPEMPLLKLDTILDAGVPG